MDIKKLSAYQEQLIWMACRYAIGRSTGASIMLPNDIYNNDFINMSYKQMSLLRKDILKELNKYTVKYCGFWHKDGPNDNNLNLFEEYLIFISEYLKKNKFSTIKLEDINDVELIIKGDDKRYNVSSAYEGERKLFNKHISPNLNAWYKFSCLLDFKNWEKITILNNEDNKKDIEYTVYKYYDPNNEWCYGIINDSKSYECYIEADNKNIKSVEKLIIEV